MNQDSIKAWLPPELGSICLSGSRNSENGDDWVLTATEDELMEF